MEENNIDLTGFVQLNDHPNYMIHPDGRVYSKTRRIKNAFNGQEYKGRILRDTQATSECYERHRIDGKMLSVHRLVALQFLPNPNNYPQVNHKNENKFDNRVQNLEWCTQEYNNVYSSAKVWKINTPKNEDIIIHNLAKFARDNNLQAASLRNVIIGKQRQYKGYTKSKDTSAIPLFADCQ